MIHVLTGDRRDRAVELYRSGLSCSAVADATGETFHCIRATMRDAGALRTKHHMLTGDLRRQALELYATGQPIRQVAAAMGVTFHCIRATVLDAGVARGRGKPPLSPETVALISHLYMLRAVTVEEIARRAGVCVSTVFLVARRGGLPRRLQPKK